MQASKAFDQAVDTRKADRRLKSAKPGRPRLRSRAARAAGFLVVLATFLVLPPRAEAQRLTLVNNLSEDTAANTAVGGLDNFQQAQKFTVPTGQNYSLDDVTIGVGNRGSDGIVVSIRDGSAADPPGTALYTLIDPASASTGHQVYSAPAGAILEGGNDYFVMLARAQNTGTSSGAQGTNGDVQDGETGWSIANVRRERSVSTWSDNTQALKIRIRGSVYVPSTPTLSIADASAKENAGHLLFDVTLSRASRNTVKVDFETISGGTATEGGDYHARRTYTHVILAGDKTAQMGFALIEDTLNDPDETVKVRLSNAREVNAYGHVLNSCSAENPQVVDSTGCNRLFLVAKIVQMSYSCGVISQGSTHFGTIFAIFATLTS